MSSSRRVPGRRALMGAEVADHYLLVHDWGRTPGAANSPSGPRCRAKSDPANGPFQDYGAAESMGPATVAPGIVPCVDLPWCPPP